MPVKIYSLRFSAHCRSVLMLARQIKLNADVIEVDLNAGEDKKPDFAKQNPTRQMPTIDDNGFVLWESRAVLQYLASQYAPNSDIYPKDIKKKAIVDRWLNFDLHLLLAQGEAVFIKHFSGVEPTEFKVKILNEMLKNVDELIGSNKYLNGNNLTIADLSLLATTSELFLFGYDLTDYPNFRRWQSALKAELPYFEEINHFEKAEALAIIEKLKARRTAARANK